VQSVPGLLVVRPTGHLELDDVGVPRQPSRLQLLRQLRHDVEPGRVGGLPESARQLEFDLVFVATAPVPLAFADGYDEWRRAFDDGKAGAFTFAVPEGVDVVEQILNR
jgi:hypothetical protein